MMAAILLAPILISAGVSVDVARIFSARVQFQQAVDSAALAAAAKQATTGTVDSMIAQKFMSGNSAGASATPINFFVDTDGALVASATFQVKPLMMSIAGFKTVPVTVKSKATALAVTKLDQVSLEITAAKGAYSKDIYFFTRDSAGNILSQTSVLQYRYDGKKSSYIPPIGGSKTVNVGDYASYGYRMDVYVDTSLKGRTTGVPRVTYYSDDPGASAWTKSTGTCADASGIQVRWEDGGDGDYKDFQYTQKCTQTSKKVTDVRLVR
jgi:hypothetical protein